MRSDVIIIGSGLGGLVCGCILAQAGKQVLVLERQAQPGGCMQSYRRGSHTFDTGLHYVGGLAEGQRLHSVFSKIGLMELPWHRLDSEGFDRVTIGDQTFCLAEGYNAFAETLAQHFPSERQALHQYTDTLRKIELLPPGDPEVQQYFSLNAYDYLTSLFHDELLVNILAGSSLKMELRRDTLPLFTFTHGNSSYVGSSWRLKGPGKLLVDKLVSIISQHGGRVICRAEAEEITETDGLATSVRCTDGQQYEAEAFISDIHPAATFALVRQSQKLSRLFRRRINSLENTFGMLTVSLVLKPHSLGYFNYNHFVYRQPNVWDFYEQEGPVGGVMVSCLVPDDDSSEARQIDLLTPLPYARMAEWTDTRIGHRGERYEQAKARLADECIALTERVIPGLKDMIAERYVSTPLTWRDYNNTPCGSAYGIRKDCRMPLLTMLSARTPVDNLLLTGQSLQLHGVEGVTMTALQTCGELLGKEYIKKTFEI